MHHKNGSRIPILVWEAPLTDASEKVIGAIEIFSDKHFITALTSKLERLQQEILTDPLSGLGNRRFLELVAKGFLTSMYGSSSYYLYLVDIDNFKTVNDIQRHLIGDQVIKMVATTLTSSLRPEDFSIRWDGDEFILLCPEVPRGTGELIAERIRLLVEQSWLECSEGNLLKVTVSIGVSKGMHGDTIEDMIQRADKQLYLAKHKGKNCYVGEVR